MCLGKFWTMLYCIYTAIPRRRFPESARDYFCCQSNQYHIYYTTSINKIKTKEKHPRGCLSFCKCPNNQAAQVTYVWVDAFFDLTTLLYHSKYVESISSDPYISVRPKPAREPNSRSSPAPSSSRPYRSYRACRIGYYLTLWR